MRCIAIDDAPCSSAGLAPPRLLGDVTLHMDLEVFGRTVRPHPGFLHHPPGRGVLRVAEREHALEADRLEASLETRDRRLGAIPMVPRRPRVVVRDLDLGPLVLD